MERLERYNSGEVAFCLPRAFALMGVGKGRSGFPVGNDWNDLGKDAVDAFAPGSCVAFVGGSGRRRSCKLGVDLLAARFA